MPGPRTRTEHMLPFNRLSGDEFERLCLWVLDLEGYKEIDLLGGSGDGGVDLTATKDGRRIYVQCKNVATFGKAATRDAFAKILEKWPEEKWPDEILLAVTAANFGKPARDAAEEAVEGTGIKCRFWPLQVFDRKVKSHLEILEEFFGTLPEPTGSPDRLFLAPRRNPYFRGRESVLEDLRQRLTSGDPVALSQTIRGLGGVGKTQTAIEYCHRHADDHSYVLWLEAETAETLAVSAAQVAQGLRLVGDDAKPEEIGTALRTWLGTNDGYLLVFDNVENSERLRSFFPHLVKGHILVTTRRSILAGLAPPLSLDVLDPEEALELIEGRLDRRLEGEEHSAAEDLADKLGYLPLALEQASAFLATRQSSITDYLASYKERRLKLLEKVPPSEGGYELTVATTWQMNIDQVEETSDASADVLKVSAFLEPQGIPLGFFTRGAPHLGSRLAALAEDLKEPIEADELLAPLLEYSLVESEDKQAKTFRVHRLVQEVTLVLLSEEERDTWKDRAIKAMSVVFPGGADRFENWAEARPLFLHALKLLAGSRETLSTAEARKLGIYVAQFAFSQGFYAQAGEFQERVLRSSEGSLGEEHPDTLTARLNLAGTLKAQGDLEGARELEERVLRSREGSLGEEHPDTLTARNNLAGTLFAQGDLEGAREF
ncbi:MAG: tetratricopeptide repeat protein, partial [Deltaproteobacteria bacterium]|nr:tetratricopeptide repeat protein [Deltaproteobacteria bacterium]